MSTFVKTLSGYSGCQIHVYENNGKPFVRKISGDKSYNARLERQIIKQASFKHDTLRTPQIYATGYINGCFYADMEYIDGRTVSSLVQNEEYELAQHAIYTVFTLFTPTQIALNDAQDITHKLFTLQEALHAFESQEVCQKTLNTLMEHAWRTHPATCHGDLTLENILVKDKHVYLIDFLDIFHDCMEADMAKMLQDLSCMWSFRHCPLNDVGVSFLRECASNLMSHYTKITHADIKQLTAMLQLTLLRIYPYLKDEPTKTFLDKQLSALL